MFVTALMAAALAGAPELTIWMLQNEERSAIGWSPDGVVLYAVWTGHGGVARLVDTRTDAVLDEVSFASRVLFQRVTPAIVARATALGVVPALDSGERVRRGGWITRSPHDPDTRLYIEASPDGGVRHWPIAAETVTVGQVLASEGTPGLLGWSAAGVAVAMVDDDGCDESFAVVVHDVPADAERARTCLGDDREAAVALLDTARAAGVRPHRAVPLPAVVRTTGDEDRTTARFWLDDGAYGLWPWAELSLTRRDWEHLTGPSGDALEGIAVLGPAGRGVFLSQRVLVLPPIAPDVPTCQVTHVGHDWQGGAPLQIPTAARPGAEPDGTAMYLGFTGRAHCGADRSWVQVWQYDDESNAVRWAPVDALPYPVQVRPTDPASPPLPWPDALDRSFGEDRDGDGLIDGVIRPPIPDTPVLGWSEHHLLLRTDRDDTCGYALQLIDATSGRTEAASTCAFGPGAAHWQQRVQAWSEEIVLREAHRVGVRATFGDTRIVEVRPREADGHVVLDLVGAGEDGAGWAVIAGPLASAPTGRVAVTSDPSGAHHRLVWGERAIEVPALPR